MSLPLSSPQPEEARLSVEVGQERPALSRSHQLEIDTAARISIREPQGFLVEGNSQDGKSAAVFQQGAHVTACSQG